MLGYVYLFEILYGWLFPSGGCLFSRSSSPGGQINQFVPETRPQLFLNYKNKIFKHIVYVCEHKVKAPVIDHLRALLKCFFIEHIHLNFRISVGT